MENNKKRKPLTLDGLSSYSQEVLFPWMQENLVAKKEFNGMKGEVNGLKGEFNGLKRDFNYFKNRSLTSQDKILKKLDTLLTDKTMRNYQEKKEKKMWAIIIKALREHRILSSRDLQEISQLEIF